MTSMELHQQGKTNEHCTSNPDLEDNGFHAIISDTTDTDQVLDKATVPDKEEFSDARLLDEDKNILFRTTLRADHKKILTRFYRLYFTGMVQTGDTLFAILADVISMAYVGTDPLWDERKDFGNECWYSPNQSTETELELSALSPIVQFIQTDSSLSEDRIHDRITLLITYEEDANTIFYKLVKAEIDKINPMEVMTAEELELWSLSGFLALTFLRFTTKNLPQMCSAFLKFRYAKNIVTVAGWWKHFSPPSQACLRACGEELSKTIAPMPKMFTKLVARFILLMREPVTATKLDAYLLASVLTHTSLNGLGLIHLISQVIDITGLEWYELVNRTYSTSTAESWELLNSFYKSQLLKDEKQYGYKWARIIDNDYFRGLSPKRHPFLATILASVIAQYDGKGIWQSEWAKSLAVDMKAAKAIGMALLKFPSKLQVEFSTAESMKILNPAPELNE